MIQFPDDFYWGAATSAYQVEGDNTNADWWQWEKRVGKEPSGAACRHYEFFRQDFDLAKELNHNAHRISVEWSRTEPEKGKFSSEALEHYKNVILSLKERGIEPVVTLHHFTNPVWFADLGGWLNKDAVKYFLRFTDKIVDALSENVRFWVTVNESNVYVYYSYIKGDWPPQERSLLKARRVEGNLLAAHIKAYRLIHDIYRRKNLDPVYVSIARNLQAFVPCAPTLRNKLGVYLRNRCFNLGFLGRLARRNLLDFIGINYYSRQLVDVEGWGFNNLMSDVCNKDHDPRRKNSMGWDIYPEGLYNLLLGLKKYDLPVFILENGICTADDNLRWEFIVEHLKSINRAMAQGVEVLGYIYWSLMDNFEWDKGFGPRFGLIEIDYSNYKRTVRESARRFAQICKTGVL